MFVEAAVRACELAGTDCLVLDMCAAPGGKSTHLLSMLGDGAVLVSNEIVRPRARILCDNITKWGRANVCVTGSDASLFGGVPEFFDMVVVDAPCSGEGLFRKDADAMLHWSEDAVEHCASRQVEILTHAWATLRPGGHLIYSTCTYNRRENEENVARLMEWGAECVAVPVAAEWGVVEVCEGGLRAYRFMPHLTASEGFFLAVVRKPGDGEAFRPSVMKGFWKPMAEKDVEGWMPVLDDLLLMRDGERVVAVSERLLEVVPTLTRHLYALQYGVEVGCKGKGQMMPSHALAASAVLANDALPMVEVNLTEAIHYLRGNPLPCGDARGHALVSYRGLTLGLVKGAGNRWNNLYPTPLRIRDMRTGMDAMLTAPL